MKMIADHPPPEMYAAGLELDVQCARCGSSVGSEHCYYCEDGYVSRHEEDPLWYDPDDWYPCHVCEGRAVWHFCLSSPEWCAANPLPGRESVERGQLEWYTVGG